MASEDEVRDLARRARELSRQVRADAALARARSAQTRLRSEALRILIVEDDRDTAEALRKLLVHVGHEAVVAGTVCDALRALGESRFSTLLCDIGLPDGNGLDLVRGVKRAHPEVRAIALSGYALQRDVDLALQAGFDAHLSKPVTFNDLLTTLA
jgi:hypothetical protein